MKRLILFLASFSGLPAGWSGGADDAQRFEYEQAQMGMPFRIVLYASEEPRAREAAQAAFDRIAELNEIFSDYERSSELSRLSRSSGQGKWVPVSPELWDVLEQSQALSERTFGAFDITVGPLVQLWRRARRQRALPGAARIAEALSRSGHQHLVLGEDRTVQLKVPGMRLDAGGIAKGYAIDEALRVLEQHGLKRALVVGSGDLVVGEPPPGRAGWKVDIAPADLPGKLAPESAVLSGGGLATSGDVFQRLIIDGRRYSHIVDPRTGVGVTNASLVTVIATNCASADSLATAVSVLGPEDGVRLIERTPGVEVRVVSPSGEGIQVSTSSGWDEKKQ